MAIRHVLMGMASFTVLGTACVSSPPTEAPDGHAMSVLEAASSAGIELDETMDRLVLRCLERRGFTVHPPGRHYEGYRLDPPEPTLPSMEEAARTGLGIGFTRLSDASVASGDRAAFDALSPDERSRYFDARNGPSSAGGAPGGCRGEVAAAVVVDWSRYLALRDTAAGTELEFTLNEVAWKAPSVARARAEWERCMSGKGHPGMPSPTIMRTRIRDELYATQHDVVAARHQEIKVALAAAECEETHQLEARHRSAWEAAYHDHVAHHLAEITAWRDFTSGALERGRRLPN